MADSDKRWMASARSRMERKGTTGSLRAIAQRRGLISGKDDKLTPSDVRTLFTSAQRSHDIKLLRKALQAANMMNVKLPSSKKKEK